MSVSTGSRTTAFSYDNNGYVDAMTTPDGRTVDYTYDVMGRLLGVDYPGGVSLSYDYDANGNLTVISNPYNITHTFDYTANDQRSMMTAPLSGSYQYIFDRDRRLQDVIFPSGIAIGNVYSSGVLDYTVTPEGVIDYTWECESSVKSAVMGTEGVSYTWDGSLLTSDTRTGLINQGITYGYDNDFALSSMGYAGSSRSFSYDNDGLLISAGSFAITRNVDNGLPETVSGGSFAQGRTFNGYGELDSSEYSVNGQGAYSWTVPLRDAAGRISRKVESLDGATNTWDYTYDNLGRLVEVRKDGVVVESYGYDLNGNRVTEVNLLRGVNRSSTYSDEDHVIMAGDDLYQFDVDGFLVSKTGTEGITCFAYSSRGELLEVVLPDGTLVTYEHDPLGRRIAKYVDGQIIEKYLWADMTTLLAVYDGNDNLISRFEYADSRLPVSMASGGGEYFLVYDQVGSLRVVTDSSGNIVKQVDYDSFGNVISDSNPSFAVPFGFAGGLYDTDTGLVRFGFRDYDPALGRWTAKDPIDFAGGDWNLYGYCLGDPVNFNDPWGLFWDKIFGNKPGDIFTVGFSGGYFLGVGFSFDRIVMPDGEADWYLTVGAGSIMPGASLSIDRGKIFRFDPFPGEKSCNYDFSKSDIEGFSVSGSVDLIIVGGEGAIAPFVFRPPGYPSPLVTAKGGLRFGTPGASLFGNWTWDIKPLDGR